MRDGEYKVVIHISKSTFMKKKKDRKELALFIHLLSHYLD